MTLPSSSSHFSERMSLSKPYFKRMRPTIHNVFVGNIRCGVKYRLNIIPAAWSVSALLFGAVVGLVPLGTVGAEAITNPVAQTADVPNRVATYEIINAKGESSTDAWWSLLPSLVTGILALAAGYLLAHQKFVSDLKGEYDKDLRTQRLGVYKKLLGLMVNLPKYPNPVKLSVDDLKQLSSAFRDWYFIDAGGLFLSGGREGSREKYFDLQDGCKILLQKANGGWKRSSTQLLREYLERNKGWKPPNEISELADSSIQNLAGHALLSEDAVNALRKLASSLRTALTKDVLTRESSAVKP